MLNLFGAGQLGENAGALDRARPLQVVSGVPGCLVGIVVGVVARAHVNDGYFKDLGRVAREVVEELALWRVGKGGVFEDV